MPGRRVGRRPGTATVIHRPSSGLEQIRQPHEGALESRSRPSPVRPAGRDRRVATRRAVASIHAGGLSARPLATHHFTDLLGVTGRPDRVPEAVVGGSVLRSTGVDRRTQRLGPQRVGAVLALAHRRHGAPVTESTRAIRDQAAPCAGIFSVASIWDPAVHCGTGMPGRRSVGGHEPGGSVPGRFGVAAEPRDCRQTPAATGCAVPVRSQGLDLGGHLGLHRWDHHDGGA